MAKNRKVQDDAAAKAKKQKIILVIGGVLLLGVAAIQVPKLMKHSSPEVKSAASVGATTPAASAPTAPAATGTVTAVSAVKVSGPRATAILAGVTIQGSGTPATGDGQLRSFSLFDPKDPFVPQASNEAPVAAAPAPAPAPAATPTESPAKATESTGSAGDATVESPPTNATITVNGAAQAVVVKQPFPKGDPLFVLVSLKPKVAKIGVSGGSFADGKTMALKKGQEVTLVNDATGVRYTLELVYTGSEPEQTESFTQATK